MVFFFITIVLGSIWARPAWNTWWTWDPRLTTAAVTELIYAAYFMLRQGIDDPEKRARFGAVYALDRRVERPDHLLCHPLLPHHSSGRHWRRKCRGGRWICHVGRHAGRLFLCPVRLYRYFHRPVLAPYPPGRAAEQG